MKRNEALREAKYYAKQEKNYINMFYCRDNKEEFWRLFQDTTPGRLTVYTNKEIVIACLFYYWMKQ